MSKSPDDKIQSASTPIENKMRQGLGARDTSDAEFLRLGRVHPRLLIAALEMRLGVALFAVRLEYGHYKPGTARNDDFQVMRLCWQGDFYHVFSVPLADKPLADAAAKQTGMRLADGVPHCFQAGKRSVFPLSGPNVWTLENDDRDNWQWKARRTHPKEAAEAELSIIQGIMQRHYDALPYEMAEALTAQGKPAWIKCRTCGHTSHNPNDVAAAYCGFCHKYHLPLPEEPPSEAAKP